MTDLWLPGYVRKDLGPDGAAYDEILHPKLGWHTWESESWSAVESAFRSYPPHLAVFPPWPGLEARVGKRQYVALNRHAYAFAGSENDDEYVVQVEVAGFATKMRDAPEIVLEWLAENVVLPIEKAAGVPRIVVNYGFHDSLSYKPKVATHYLASSSSEIRLTSAQLRSFSGHLGHQHMPYPDKHWDPGALPIVRILSHADRLTKGKKQMHKTVTIKIEAATKKGSSIVWIDEIGLPLNANAVTSLEIRANTDGSVPNARIAKGYGPNDMLVIQATDPVGGMIAVDVTFEL